MTTWTRNKTYYILVNTNVEVTDWKIYRVNMSNNTTELLDITPSETVNGYKFAITADSEFEDNLFYNILITSEINNIRLNSDIIKISTKNDTFVMKGFY